jgi:hypothetical protein
MIFLRGKMMRDDSIYIKELEGGAAFMKGPSARRRTKFWLFWLICLGYAGLPLFIF